MSILQTTYKNTQIKCYNLPFMNHTSIVAPNYKGMRISFTIKGRIAEDIVKDKAVTKLVYNGIKNRYRLYQC